MINRPQRHISFLVVWLTMFSCVSVRSQSLIPQPERLELSSFHYFQPFFGDISFLGTSCKDPALTQDLGYAQGLTSAPLPEHLPFLRILPSMSETGQGSALYSQPGDLYYTQSGFFCKREWEFEKTTHIPFRFRLGSLSDCNALEGKH